MTYAVGSLVHARGRDWVVLPDSSDDVVRIRPLGGTDAEIVGILPELEPVTEARFEPPTVDNRGDFRSARHVREETGAEGLRIEGFAALHKLAEPALLPPVVDHAEEVQTAAQRKEDRDEPFRRQMFRAKPADDQRCRHGDEEDPEEDCLPPGNGLRLGH